MKHAFQDAFRKLGYELGFGENPTHNVEVVFDFDSDEVEIEFSPAEPLCLSLIPVIDLTDPQADE